MGGGQCHRTAPEATNRWIVVRLATIEVSADHAVTGRRLFEEDAVTELKKGSRVTGGDRDTLSVELKGKYEGGASIRALAEASGRSYGFVHRILSESGVALRGRGGATRRKVT